MDMLILFAVASPIVMGTMVLMMSRGMRAPSNQGRADRATAVDDDGRP
jgi:hypothetical protein